MSLAILPSAVRTASGNLPLATAGLKPERWDGGVFQLAVTAAATAAGDTLNVYIQHSTDNGTTWDDFVSFTQVLGNGGAKNLLAFWTTDSTAPVANHAVADGTLAAGTSNQGPVGDLWRVKWVIVNASNPSFTFAVFFAQQPLSRVS